MVEWGGRGGRRGQCVRQRLTPPAYFCQVDILYGPGTSQERFRVDRAYSGPYIEFMQDTRLEIRVSRELLSKFKAHCTDRGKSIGGMVREYMEGCSSSPSLSEPFLGTHVQKLDRAGQLVEKLARKIPAELLEKLNPRKPEERKAYIPRGVDTGRLPCMENGSHEKGLCNCPR